MATLTVVSALLAALATGCGSPEAIPTIVPLPTAEPTQTPEVGYAVAITPVKRATTTPAPRPTSTRFVVPEGSFVTLDPSTGPPASRTIVVRAGHLPASTPVELGWSIDGKRSPVQTSVSTNRYGNLTSRFSVPASPPGSYRVTVVVGNTRYAWARYVVLSEATLAVAVSQAGSGERLSIRGRHFLSNLKVILVAYPLATRGKPIVIGQTRCSVRGSFAFTGMFRALGLGQYTLRAYSQSALAAQMAETFFQVVI